ncbi:MAG: hypothetical protein PHG67_09775 [Bacteroidales bacterium]|jgi:hypothetical protein|nr:hypothetical protein [Bacteroidales bacterium]
MSSKIRKFCVYWSILTGDKEYPNQMVVQASSKSKARNEIKRMLVTDEKCVITKVEAI